MSPVHDTRLKMSGEKKKVGFALMDPKRRLELARKGGANVPRHQRSFAKNPQLASEAGKKGGQSVAANKRSFSTNPELASDAGKKGGRRSQELHAAAKAQSGSTGA